MENTVKREGGVKLKESLIEKSNHYSNHCLIFVARFVETDKYVISYRKKPGYHMTCLQSTRYQAFMSSAKNKEVKRNTFTQVDLTMLREDYKSIKVKSNKTSTREWQANLKSIKNQTSG